ncbi:hypothetical protein SVIOM74S_07161 [Streptomyces violarus]
MRSYAATEANSSVKPVSKSAFLSTSRRSSTPQRRTTSSLSAWRPVGSSHFSNFGTEIHGSLCRVVTLTPPAEPSVSAAVSRSRPFVIRCFRSVMHSRASSG